MLKALKQIEDWFSDESHWCQRYSRLSANGFPVKREDPLLAKRCLGEAISVFAPNEELQLIALFMHELPRCSSVVDFNDNDRTTIEDVRAVIRKVRDGIVEARIANEVEVVKERAQRAARIVKELNEA